MRVCISNFDNNLIIPFLQNQPNVELITLSNSQKNINCLLENLLKYKIDIFIVIAPQWQWGRYVEVISKNIMDSGIKLLCGEGSLFRWFGPKELCGRDVGFYLCPWGYSGNSKMSQNLPIPNLDDIINTEKLRSNLKQWKKDDNNGKILILGQLENDKSKYYANKIKNNNSLIETCISVYGSENIVFRPHPKDNSRYTFPVKIIENSENLYKIIHNYYACCSINSTGSIEAMCAGVPVINDGVAFWHGAGKLIQNIGNEIVPYEYDEYTLPLASIVHLHYLVPYGYGNPYQNALNFYSNYNEKVFVYNCINQVHEPTVWEGKEVI